MKKSALIFTFLCGLILFSQFPVFSQTENKETRWTKIESPSGEMSFSVPSNYLVDNENDISRLIAYQDNATINVSIEKTGDAQNRVKQARLFIAPAQREGKAAQFTLGNVIGNLNTIDKEDFFSMSVYAASPKEVYSISVTAGSSANPSVLRFLNSVKLGDRYFLKQTAPPVENEEAKFSIDSLKTSPVVIEALKRKDAEKMKLKYPLKGEKNLPFNGYTEETTKYSRSLIILRKPRAEYTDSGRSGGVSGMVKLGVVFQANGEIGDIVVLNKLGSGLDEKSAEAARKIKFLPAEIDGKPVDAFKIVIYSFTIY